MFRSSNKGKATRVVGFRTWNKFHVAGIPKVILICKPNNSIKSSSVTFLFRLLRYHVLTIEPSFEFNELFSRIVVGCVTLKSIWLKGLYFCWWSRFSFPFLSELSSSKRLGEITFLRREGLRNSFSFATFLGIVRGWSRALIWASVELCQV